MPSDALQDNLSRAASAYPPLLHPTSAQQIRPGANGLTKLEHATLVIAAGITAGGHQYEDHDDIAEEAVGIAVALFKTLDALDVSTL